jgi:hypothetical protein
MQCSKLKCYNLHSAIRLVSTTSHHTVLHFNTMLHSSISKGAVENVLCDKHYLWHNDTLQIDRPVLLSNSCSNMSTVSHTTSTTVCCCCCSSSIRFSILFNCELRLLKALNTYTNTTDRQSNQYISVHIHASMALLLLQLIFVSGDYAQLQLPDHLNYKSA